MEGLNKQPHDFNEGPGLTNQSREGYSNGGDKIMSTDNNPENIEQPKEKQPEKPQTPKNEASEGKQEEQKQPESQRADAEKNSGENRDIFFGMKQEDLIPTTEEELKARVKREFKDILESDPNPKETQELMGKRFDELKKEGNFMTGINMGWNLGKNPLALAREITEGIRDGKIGVIDANPYLRSLCGNPETKRLLEAEILRQNIEFKRVTGMSMDDWAEKFKKLNGPEQTEELKKFIERINPDNMLSDSLIDVIAQNEEASEKFVSKIIYKPLIEKPEGEYSLSFYAGINFESFLTAVGNVEKEGVTKDMLRKRQIDYAEQHEMALRLHEGNKATVTQSANIDALMNIARTITNNRLQTGIKLDGVEQARQIIELSFGRLFGNHDRLLPQKYQPEILDWARTSFVQLAKTGELKSKFQDKDGKFRNLEEWEVDRAFALARNYHSTLLRTPELVTWGNIPSPQAEWLKSPVGETMVRIIGGFKYLQSRFRQASTGGGQAYINVINQDLEKEYKGKLNKIGVLDIRKELIPLGLFGGGSFEKGWRPTGAYLNTEFMKINIKKLYDTLQQESDTSIPGKRASARALLDKFVKERMHGDLSADVNLGEFLVYNDGFMSEYYGQNLKIKTSLGEVTVPKDSTAVDPEKSKNDMEELLLPLLGLKVKKGKEEDLRGLRERLVRNAESGIESKEKRGDIIKGKINDQGKWEYEYFDYDPTEDQVNFSLGVLLRSEVSRNIKTVLWRKAAETMPLRIAYLLANEGVRPYEEQATYTEKGKKKTDPIKISGIAGYNNVKGERLDNGDYQLFNKDFESKLIRLHMIRMRKQKEIFENSSEDIKTRRHSAIKLETLFKEVKFTDEEERFVRELQKLGMEKAADLAQVPFPHVPFLDDVPYQKAEYTNLGPEVYARRMNDEKGYSEAANAAGEVINNLSKPYPAMEEAWEKAKEALAGPEGAQTSQKMVYRMARAYFTLAKQYDRARIPLYRDIAHFLNKPSSDLQKWFTSNANCWNVRVLNVQARHLATKGLIRNERLPGEEMSQTQSLLAEFKAQPYRVVISELLNALMQWLLFSALAFPGNIKEKK